jgi:non-specific serine/threonine protein kinase/serine/threonine-protein kinase
LEKDRERRYGSAAALASDIARHLHSEPVEAGPPSALYRFRKLVRRNRLAFTASAGIVLLLVAGIAVSTWQALRAQRAEVKAVKERERADGEAGISKAVSAFLRHDLLAQAGSRRQADTRLKPNPKITVKEVLDRAAEGIGDRFLGQPLVEAAIQNTIGITYGDLGDADNALIHLRRALELSRAYLGDAHADTLANRNDVASALADQGKLAEAEKEYRETLSTQQRLYGMEHPMTLQARNNLALVLRDQGRSTEAENELRAILEVKTRLCGGEDPETLLFRSNLATVLQTQQKFSEAEMEHRAVLEILRRKLGEEHPDTLISRSNLAQAMRDRGRLREAEQEFRKVLDSGAIWVRSILTLS